MSNELERLTNTGRRTLSIQEELTQNKVWNPASQRYRQKVSNMEAYKHDLLYVSALNIYLDKKKFPTRCLRLEVEQESGLVWYRTGNYYCYKRPPELEKQINDVVDESINSMCEEGDNDKVELHNGSHLQIAEVAQTKQTA